MSATDRPTVVKLDITDLRRAVDDASFRLLVSSGWTVLTSVVIADDEGQHIHLVMVPPRTTIQAEPQLQPEPWTKGSLLAGFALGIAAFVLFQLTVG